MQKLTQISYPVEAVQILPKSLEECNYDAMQRGFYDLIAQQFSTIFSAGCYFSYYTKYNHISAIPTTPTKTNFVQWNHASPFHFHLVPNFRNTIGQIHQGNIWVLAV